MKEGVGDVQNPFHENCACAVLVDPARLYCVVQHLSPRMWVMRQVDDVAAVSVADIKR
jgi:hypothetical protein